LETIRDSKENMEISTDLKTVRELSTVERSIPHGITYIPAATYPNTTTTTHHHLLVISKTPNGHQPTPTSTHSLPRHHLSLRGVTTRTKKS
jgi:hypothetical protein